ncbi:MAG: DNA-3-methyladenine glycosylase 2 family protein [Chloroflexi bacterium]|nr:DNA-3-methyladenine glycosylase 2 family protein [Chloroflexota bacterium]
MIERRVRLRGPLDLAETLGPLRHGAGDRTIRLSRRSAAWATLTPDGAATARLDVLDDELHVRAWGDGAGWMAQHAPALVGEDDRPEELVAQHSLIRDLQRRHPGLRLPSSRRVVHALVPSIFEQKVTGTEAFRAYAGLLRRYGSPAPGPMDLLLPPAPATLAGLPYHAFHPLGVERRRADVVRRAAARHAWLEAADDAALATRRLMSLPGVGPWTAAEVVRSAFGDPDAVSVGDFHIPNMVAWALAGEARADDARMLEILEPYRGQRGRVQRLLEVAGFTAPRYGPRMAPRRIAEL